MQQRCAPRLGRRLPERGDDQGVALVVAIALVGLVSVLMVTMLTFSIREGRSSGRDRQRSSAVTSAEGAVDKTLAAMQNVKVANLPCGAPTVTSSTTAVPDTMSISTSVAYYASNGTQLTDCTAIKAGTVPVARALVMATSTSNALAGSAPAVRTVSTLVAMKATMSNSASLNKAIFGNAGVSAANKVTLSSTSGANDADIYTNGDFQCNNNQSYAGSIYAQGSITMSNTCQVAGDSWAKTGYTSNNPQVRTAGNVLVSQGTAAINSGSVGGTIKAKTITPPGICSPSTKCVTGASAVGDPPRQDFPVLKWDAATQTAWRNAGYTNVVTLNSPCEPNGDFNAPGKWLYDNASTLPADTVLVTPCQVKMQPNNNTVKMAKNIAIFASGGVSLSNGITFESTSAGDPRYLYLIQPYDAATVPCTTDGIALDNRVTIAPSVNALYYSPCNIRKANNTDHHGQIYAGGRAIFDNQLTMYYTPLPVYGVTSSTSGNSVASYSVDVLYKREDRS